MSTLINAQNTPVPGSDSGRQETVKYCVGSMKFGVVQIVVHDSAVVRIERTEKLWMDRREPETNYPD